MRAIFLGVALLGATGGQGALADPVLATETTRRLCLYSSETGGSLEVNGELSATAKANIIRILGEAGIEIGGDFSIESWEGIPVLENPEVALDFTSCIREMFPQVLVALEGTGRPPSETPNELFAAMGGFVPGDLTLDEYWQLVGGEEALAKVNYRTEEVGISGRFDSHVRPFGSISFPDATARAVVFNERVIGSQISYACGNASCSDRCYYYAKEVSELFSLAFDTAMEPLASPSWKGDDFKGENTRISTGSIDRFKYKLSIYHRWQKICQKPLPGKACAVFVTDPWSDMGCTIYFTVAPSNLG
jgi:hypothetical protein